MTESADYDRSATPTAHKTTHQHTGADEISVEGLAGQLADLQPLNTTQHTAIGDAAPHHARYADAEAVSAMGAKADANPLNHDRYSHPSAIQCTLATGDVPDPLIIGEIKAKDANGLKLSDDAGQGLLVNDGGITSNAYQPAFLLTKDADQTNLAINTVVTILWQTEIKDQGGNFADNIFTAPITGLYQINILVRLVAVDIDAASYQIAVISSNRTYSIAIAPKFTSDPLNWMLQFDTLVDMDANDTIYVAFYQQGGAQQSSIVKQSFFSGFLVC